MSDEAAPPVGGEPVARRGAADSSDPSSHDEPRLDLDAVAVGPPGAHPAGQFPAPEQMVTSVRPPAPRPTSTIRGRDLAVGAGLLTLAVVLPLFRQQGTRSWQQIMSEDGSIYAQQAIRDGGSAVLLRSYAGYLQLGPRLLGMGIPLVPVRDLALYLALAGTTVGALLGWFVYWAAKDWVEGRGTRLVLASFLILMPALGGENTANVVNTIWLFAAAAPWALISYRERPRDVGIRSAVAFLAAASTPLCVLFVPLGIGWVIFRRTRAALIVTLSFGVGLALQGVVVLSAGATSDSTWPNSTSVLLRGLGGRVFGVFLLGTKGVDALWGARSGVIYLGAPLLVGLLFVVALVGTPRRQQVMAAIFMVSAVAFFALPVWGRGATLLDASLAGGPPAKLQLGLALRYSVAPIVFVASSFAILVTPVGHRRPSARRLGSVVFAAQVCLLALLGFSVRNYNSSNFDWRRTVDAAFIHSCAGRPSDRLVSVPTSLSGFYTVQLPCRDLAP